MSISVTAPAAPRAEPRLVAVPAVARPGGLDRARLRVLSVLTVVAMLAGLFGMAAFHAQLAQGAYELDELDGWIAERQVELHELRLEVERLESPRRIREQAEMLGLVAVEPGSVSYLEVEAGVVAAVAGSSAGGRATTVQAHNGESS